MVGDPALREVVGADALAAVAAADLQAPRFGLRGVLALALGIEQLRLQALHRLVAVGVLAALGLALHHHAGRHG